MRGSDQDRWLVADLARHRSRCTLAYWHRPHFAAGKPPALGEFRRFWDILYRFRVDLVLNGHEHSYQRFAPQSPDGVLDRKRGIRELVVGTGGRSHDTYDGPLLPNMVAYNSDTYGVLALTLRKTGYSRRFLPEPGKSFTDFGSAACH